MEKFKDCFNRKLACLHKEIYEFIVKQWLSVNCYKRNGSFFQKEHGQTGIQMNIMNLLLYEQADI